ncbi:ABC transporter periplasmic binding protein precursor [Oscillochloris trichoides DG-6]|uniref:ABC transporter periplasmic binding protein n=1 Tax=Oscillochloris trichoides DG-6 TaxID=765420 RepID=E1IF17_9CHLR|nr:zinc ABC transporter substrate-binding protein [Oscillochloris trichoides]EFO80221.1 ABC transporter periplasmic binding protein precursor [Oscillochloris trichoides DG-6]
MRHPFARSFSVLALLSLLGLLVACGNTPAAQTTPSATTLPATAESAAATTVPTTDSSAAAAPIKVVATFSILGEFVQHVGGEHIALTTLVGPGGDAHTYEPTPRDSAALAEAALVIENGLLFESWIDDLYTASGSRATRVAVSAQITPLPTPEGSAHTEAEDTHAEDAEDHGEYDPHVWHDVGNAQLMVAAIRDALVAADPANAAVYSANAESYIAQLKELDSFIQIEVAKLPADQRKLITTHDTLGYLAHAYGFEVIGTALGVTTESSDPSAGEIAQLVNAIRSAGVRAIFAENVANPSLMQSIADEAGVTLAPTLYTDALGTSDSPGASYIEMMRYNVTTIVQSLAS